MCSSDLNRKLFLLIKEAERQVQPPRNTKQSTGTIANTEVTEDQARTNARIDRCTTTELLKCVCGLQIFARTKAVVPTTLVTLSVDLLVDHLTTDPIDLSTDLLLRRFE